MTDSRHPAPGFLRRLDARMKLPLLMAACLIGQHLPNAWIAPWLLLLSCMFFAREMRFGGVMAMARGGLWFVAFWLALKALSAMLDGTAPVQAFVESLPTALRLAALVLVGMAFVGLSSPLETGRAAAWYLRGFVGDRAWKPALAVALVAWFLPVTLCVTGEVLTAMRTRGLQLPWRKKMVLLAGNSLRILERKAAEVAVGLASRRLDDDRSWCWRS